MAGGKTAGKQNTPVRAGVAPTKTDGSSQARISRKSQEGLRRQTIICYPTAKQEYRMRHAAMLALLFLFFGCGACATKMNQVPAGPPEYQQGFLAGCDSGYVAAGHVYYRWNKDVSRYPSDELYKQGWDDGFQTCKGKYESIQRMMR
jgi:hypothetical protein